MQVTISCFPAIASMGKADRKQAALIQLGRRVKAEQDIGGSTLKIDNPELVEKPDEFVVTYPSVDKKQEYLALTTIIARPNGAWIFYVEAGGVDTKGFQQEAKEIIRAAVFEQG